MLHFRVHEMSKLKLCVRPDKSEYFTTLQEMIDYYKGIYDNNSR